jgi:hypothetical protein
MRVAAKNSVVPGVRGDRYDAWKYERLVVPFHGQWAA